MFISIKTQFYTQIQKRALKPLEKDLQSNPVL